MLRPNWEELDIYKKRTQIYELWFKKDGISQDITGWTVYFTMKKNWKDEDSEAVIVKTISSETGADYAHSDPTKGKTIILLSSEDTNIDAGIYYYDMTFKDTDDNVKTIKTGRIRVTEPVTQRA